MAEPLRFHPLVADDLSAATAWYDDISRDLGNRFRAAVDSRLDAVELRPESFGMVDPPLRAARAERFPYLIVFEHSRLKFWVSFTLLPIPINGVLANAETMRELFAFRCPHLSH